MTTALAARRFFCFAVDAACTALRHVMCDRRPPSCVGRALLSKWRVIRVRRVARCSLGLLGMFRSSRKREECPQQAFGYV